MASRLSIYNGALLRVSEEPLVTESDEGKARRLLDSVWDGGGIKRCLEKGQWRFAIRSQALSGSTDFEESFGYQYQFEKPEDWVRVTAVCTDGYYNAPLLRYSDEGSFLYADIDPLYVQFVSNDELYGLNIGEWPESFSEYVEAYFASKIVLPLTSDKERWAVVEKVRKSSLDEALSNDAMKEPTKFMPAGSWTSSRWGRSRGPMGDGGTGGSLIG